MSRLIELNGVGKSYPLPDGNRLNILQDLALHIDRNEVIAIVGRSGSGKSTLLNILGLLDHPTVGRYEFDGANTTAMSDAARSRLRGAKIGFIFQQFHLLERRTALENVAEPLLLSNRRDISERKRRAMDLLAQVDLMDRAHLPPTRLSGGEQQRVAIARALVRSPQLILADEPTGSLDESTGKKVCDLLFDLVRSNGRTLILVTHDRGLAARADRVLALRSGTLHREEA